MSGGGNRLSSNRKGFTLAEVLITLGIIGVVAAMTMPVLISNYQKTVYSNQAKKTYSMLSQALTLSVEKYGCKPACYYWYPSNCKPHSCVRYSSDGKSCLEYQMADGSPLASDVCGATAECKDFESIFLSNLKVIKTCQNKAYDNGCIPKYSGLDDIIKEGNENISDEDFNKKLVGQDGYASSALMNKSSAYVLASGEILMNYSGMSLPRIIIFDVNGKKGPNKWGYDVFAMHTATKSSTDDSFFFVGKSMAQKGGVDLNKIITNRE